MHYKVSEGCDWHSLLIAGPGIVADPGVVWRPATAVGTSGFFLPTWLVLLFTHRSQRGHWPALLVSGLEISLQVIAKAQFLVVISALELHLF